MKEEFLTIKRYLEEDYPAGLGVKNPDEEIWFVCKEMYLMNIEEMLKLCDFVEAPGHKSKEAIITSEKFINDSYVTLMQVMPDQAFIKK